MARTLTANRDALPFPAGITDQVNPTIDIFGSQRIAEAQIATVQGALAGLEVLHTVTPPDTVRLYLSMSYTHDDPIARNLVPGRVIPTAAGFPFASFRDQLSVPTSQNFAVRNILTGPNSFIGARSNAMAVGARMAITVVWIEMPLGEYVNSIT